MVKDSFASRLKALRVAAGLSQRRLAKQAGITSQAVSLLERGQSIPSWPTVEALADALGIRTEDFRAKKNLGKSAN